MADGNKSGTHGVRDVQSWIELLKSEGLFRQVDGKVDWNVELGTIARMVVSSGGPALLFTNIKDYEKGRFRKLFCGSMGSYNHLALLLGQPKNGDLRDLVIAARQAFRKRGEMKVVERSQAALKKNVIKGDDIDVHDFPTPKWHTWDGGRFINTFAQVITKDPETGVYNMGMYRGMIAGKREIATLLVPSQGWGGHYSKVKDAQKDLKVAVCYAPDPLLTFLSASPMTTPGYSELEVLAGIRGEPTEMVKCETSDLLVPTSAQIVLEGTVSFDPKTYRMEGPFAEHCGYYGGAGSLKPTITVDCITYRDDPIYQGTVESIRPGWANEDSHMISIGVSALVWNQLEACGIPGITDVWMNNDGSYYMIYVQIRKRYRGQAKQIASAIYSMSFANWGLKNVMVVEEDIDIRDPGQLEWAFCTRVNAAEGGIEISYNQFGSVLDPSTPFEERDLTAYGSGRWARVLIDATRNWNFKRREAWNNAVFPPVCVLTKEEEDAARARLPELGLGDINYQPRMRIDRDEDLKWRYSLSARPTPKKDGE